MHCCYVRGNRALLELSRPVLTMTMTIDNAVLGPAMVAPNSSMIAMVS